MKTRAEVSLWWRTRADWKTAIPNKNMRNYRGLPWHMGKCEVRELLDFIYGGPPQHKNEEV